MTSIVISSQAYIKIYLHAAKYDSSSIGGYLIGKKSSNKIEIDDVIATNHGIPAGPILETVGDIIENLYSESDGIVGYYYGDELIPKQKSAVLPKYVKNIQQTIASNIETAVILEIVGENMDSREELFLKVRGDGSIALKDKEEDVNKLIDFLLLGKRHQKFSDYEDFLNSTATNARDYRNIDIGNEIKDNLGSL